MIYVLRLPRALGMLTLALGLLAIAATVFLVNVLRAAFMADTLDEAMRRVDCHRERVR